MRGQQKLPVLGPVGCTARAHLLRRWQRQLWLLRLRCRAVLRCRRGSDATDGSGIVNMPPEHRTLHGACAARHLRAEPGVHSALHFLLCEAELDPDREGRCALYMMRL